MPQYLNLSAPPEQSLRDIIEGKLQTRGSTTGAAGVKDLGPNGDVVWTRPDGGAVSVRDVDLDLADARQRIEDAEQSLVDSAQRLAAAEQAVQSVKDALENIEVGGVGSIIKDHPPEPADGEGLPDGAAWLHYDTTGALVGMYRWDGAEWEGMPLDRQMIPTVDIGSGTFGDLTGDRLTVTGTLATRVVQAMTAEVKQLVVTEEAVLTHATLLGQTVVDDINIRGKLIGTDGVFTGTVDFANINVTDEILAGRVSGQTIQGVELLGSTVEAANTDGLSVFLSGTAVPWSNPVSPGFIPYPGMRFSAPGGGGLQGAIGAGPIGAGDTTADFGGVGSLTMSILDSNGRMTGSGVRVSAGSAALYGARPSGDSYAGGVEAYGTYSVMWAGDRSSSSPHGRVNVDRTGAVVHGGTVTIEGRLSAVPIGRGYGLRSFSDSIQMSPENGATGFHVTIHDNYASISPSGKAGWGLTLTGTEAKLQRWNADGSGGTAAIDLLKANATTVVAFQNSNQWPMASSPTQILVTEVPGGKFCQARARIVNSNGTFALPRQQWVTLNLGPIPAALRGGETDYIEVRLPQGDARGLVEMAYSINRVRIKSLDLDVNWSVGASVWLDMQWLVPN